MYASTIISRASMVSAMRDSIQATKPTITIKLKDENPETGYKAPATFTTLDKIEGEIIVAMSTDTRFDDIQISFEGSERIWMEKYGSASATLNHVQTSRTFLRLRQPVDESAMPMPRIFEKGRTYTFPFTFVVPESLLPTSCSHRYKNNLVQEAHLRLPPTLGDGTNSTIAGIAFDDLAPDMTRISYSLHVRVLTRREKDGKLVITSDSLRKVRIIPSYEDLPPIVVDGNDRDYVLQREKVVRKGFLKGKLGRLTVEAQEPRALHICASPSASLPTTTIPMKVTFTPAAANCEPPSLSTLHARLRAVTMYSTQPIAYFPTKGNAVADPTLGVYHEASFLSSRCLANVQWTKRDSPTGSFYITNIQVPVTQPKYKILVPTFYSCLSARTYTVELNLSVNAYGGLRTNSSITMKVPIQVSCQKATSHRLSLATYSVAETEPTEQTHPSPDYDYTGVDSYGAEFFRPRSIAPPSTIRSPHPTNPQLPSQIRILE